MKADVEMDKKQKEKERQEMEEKKRRQTVEIIEELADRITEELESQLEEEEGEETRLSFDSEGAQKSRLFTIRMMFEGRKERLKERVIRKRVVFALMGSYFATATEKQATGTIDGQISLWIYDINF